LNSLTDNPSLNARSSLPNNRTAARTLIVEPDASVARICSKALTHERFDPRVVSSVPEMWEQIEAWRPQIFVIGDEFFDSLGTEVVSELRNRTNAPIVFITSTDSVGYISNAFEAGADDVIVRPIVPPLLLVRCLAHMRRAYRYSVPPAPKRTPPPPKPLGADLAAKKEKVAESFKQWPSCEACGYMGPNERFKSVDVSGESMVACPACMNNRIRFVN
jgi:DNA-binding response OmpR family regulator